MPAWGFCVKGGEVVSSEEGSSRVGPTTSSSGWLLPGPAELDNGSFGDIQKHAGNLVACVGILRPFGLNGHAVRFLDRAEKTRALVLRGRYEKFA